MTLEVREDITCNLCMRPITDSRQAHMFWNRRSGHHAMIAVAHAHCDTVDIMQYYSSWIYLSEAVERWQEMRKYFNVAIIEGRFTRQEVKDGLEQIFRLVPDDYFHFTEQDYVAYMEGTGTDESQGTSTPNMARCPNCGALGRNHQPPDIDSDEGYLIVPFECLDCGHGWTERTRDNL